MLTNKSTPKLIKRQPEFPAFNISFESGIWKKQSAWDLPTTELFLKHAAEFETLPSRHVWMRSRTKLENCCADCHGDTIHRWALQFNQQEFIAFAQCQEVLQHFRILYLQCFFLPASDVSMRGLEEFETNKGLDFYSHSFNLLISAAFLLKDADIIYFAAQGSNLPFDNFNFGKLHKFWVPRPLFSKYGQFMPLKFTEVSSEEWFERPEFEVEKEKLKGLLRRKVASQVKKVQAVPKKSKGGFLTRIFYPK